MNIKLYASLFTLIIGIVLIFLAIHAEHQISEAKNVTQDIKNYFENNPDWNPIIKFFGGKPEEKVSSYDTPALLTLSLGVILTVGGAVMAVMYRKKS